MHATMPLFLYLLVLAVVSAMIDGQNDGRRQYERRLRSSSASGAIQQDEPWSASQRGFFVTIALVGGGALVVYLLSDHNKERLARIADRNQRKAEAFAYRTRGLNVMQVSNGLWRDARGRVRN